MKRKKETPTVSRPLKNPDRLYGQGGENKRASIQIMVRVPVFFADHAKMSGAKRYGGISKYINHLIEQDFIAERKRNEGSDESGL